MADRYKNRYDSAGVQDFMRLSLSKNIVIYCVIELFAILCHMLLCYALLSNALFISVLRRLKKTVILEQRNTGCRHRLKPVQSSKCVCWRMLAVFGNFILFLCKSLQKSSSCIHAYPLIAIRNIGGEDIAEKVLRIEDLDAQLTEDDVILFEYPLISREY